MAGLGFDATDQPFLRLNDMDAGEQLRFEVFDRTFSLRRLPKRICTGSFDLATGERKVCPGSVELLEGSSDLMCPNCRMATGFNPAFYNTDLVSPQQRSYNAKPHFVYLAYFSPAYVKVGITSEERGMRRLLEQGARAALVVGHFENADEARELEARLSKQEGICETMRAQKKAELLADERYAFDEASQVLNDAAQRLGLQPQDSCIDLNPRYFVGAPPTTDQLQLPKDAPDDVCGGHCIGMVGADLIFEQGGIDYISIIKDWESHVVEVFLDETLYEYDFEPIQMSLL